MTEDLVARWTSAEWRDQAHGWIRDRVRVTGPIEESKVRFWSVVLKVPVDGGWAWFKENAPSQAFEAGLVAAIDRIAPGRVAPVLGVDADRGWLLTADLGTPLGERRPEDDEAAAAELADLVLAWSSLQRGLVRHEAAMRGARVPAFEDWHAMPYAVALADHLAGLPEGDGRRLSSQDRRLVDDGLQRLGQASARLEASGIPDSLEHNDLHLWNAFRGPTGATSFIDLGDAVWSHPFASWRIALWITRSNLGFGPGSAPYERIVDAGLEPWTDLAPREELRAVLSAAERLSCLHRAESWRRLMADVPVECIPADWLDAPASWLLSAVAEDPYVDAMSD